MNLFTINNFVYLFFHFLLGILFFYINFAVFPYMLSVFFFGTLWIVNNKDSNFEALAMILYCLGFEVMFRMKSDGVAYDIGKYAVLYFCVLGYSFKRISLKAWPYFAVLLLFIPGIVLTVNTFFFQIDVRRKIMFNLLGPFCLVSTALYCIGKQITLTKINQLLRIAAGPIISILISVFLYTPNLREIITSTSSNFDTSGGFGPNQMSVILGLGSFLFFTQFAFGNKNSKINSILCLILCFYAFYRSILTFSRGGTITLVVMILFFLIALFLLVNKKSKGKLIRLFFGVIIIGLVGWSYSIYQSNGMIEKRYANQDAKGRVKQSVLTGREEIMEHDLDLFSENPLFGVGAGISSASRDLGPLKGTQAHSEPTRLLSEHGSLGIIILLILVFFPLINYFNKRQFSNVYFFPFLIFWALTINHAATRIVAPSVIYALTLLNVSIKNEEDEDSVPG